MNTKNSQISIGAISWMWNTLFAIIFGLWNWFELSITLLKIYFKRGLW